MTARSELLIDAEELQTLLQQGVAPVVADCRFQLGDTDAGERQYVEGHIPGAQYLHLERDLSARRAVHGGRHPLPEAQAFAAVMQRIGLGADRLLVVYDDSPGAMAARLWWMARYFGHRQVRILDGGISAWRAQGLALDRDIVTPAPGDFVARTDPHMVIDYAALQHARACGSVVLVDSREAARYLGQVEPIDPRAGHIPGAINRPWMNVVGASGQFREAGEQMARWQDIGEPCDTVVYCGSGVTACVNLLSLELAGLHGARLYPGSWSDWCSHADAEIATDSQ